MGIESRGFPPGDMRVSDADRDRAVAELSEHFQTGRLTQAEFSDRSASALQARTGDELSALFADLPPGPEAATGRGPVTDAGVAPGPVANVGGGPPAHRVLRARYVVLLVIALSLASTRVVISGHPVHFSFGFVVPVLVLFFVVRHFTRR